MLHTVQQYYELCHPTHLPNKKVVTPPTLVCVHIFCHAGNITFPWALNVVVK